MANRVTAADVQVIFETDMTTPTTKAFIDTAHRIVEDNLVSVISDASTLTEIEKYLSAHLASLRDPRIDQRKFGDSSVKFQGKTGMRLDSTYYGQVAKQLDTSGELSKLGTLKASMNMIEARDV